METWSARSPDQVSNTYILIAERPTAMLGGSRQYLSSTQTFPHAPSSCAAGYWKVKSSSSFWYVFQPPSGSEVKGKRSQYGAGVGVEVNADVGVKAKVGVGVEINAGVGVDAKKVFPGVAGIGLARPLHEANASNNRSDTTNVFTGSSSLSYKSSNAAQS